ncbi:SH3 domain-containing protein [Prolixibacteraceae bacterium Z1-6]|uniref:SH3 domain-containing protein n=1 Tax=Draconibacterium aestuarii TaxID=2998507 RepID=A0A9X3J5C3_9BACT|nr:SH3 domain-containing protein [Prolixibacteraceae bacterium Z1-6]
MEKKFGFLKMESNEFREWITGETINRTVFFIQQHHTYSPNYSNFNGNNHFQLQRNMKNYHVTHNGWNDIGQHFTIFPDGMILTGRSIERSPACMKGKNANSVCIESIGNFDVGGDEMTTVQREAIVQVTGTLCIRFGISPNTNTILYHHWFNLSTGKRNNGTGGNKSCPGSAFFGGNKVDACEANFIPLLREITGDADDHLLIDDFDKYICVTATRLNVRSGPGISYNLAGGVKPVKFGSVLKSFREENGWCKINASDELWISAKYTRDVTKGKITANVLNIRTGPGTNNNVVDTLTRGSEIIIEEERNGWYKLNLEEKWVSKTYVDVV